MFKLCLNQFIHYFPTASLIRYEQCPRKNCPFYFQDKQGWYKPSSFENFLSKKAKIQIFRLQLYEKQMG